MQLTTTKQPPNRPIKITSALTPGTLIEVIAFKGLIWKVIGYNHGVYTMQTPKGTTETVTRVQLESWIREQQIKVLPKT